MSRDLFWTLRVVMGAALSVALLDSASAQTLGPLTQFGISPPGASQRAPAMAYGPCSNTVNCYVVVWEEDRSVSTGVDLYIAEIDESGIIVQNAGIDVAVRNGDQTSATIAFSPQTLLSYVVSWIDPVGGLNDLYVDRYRADQDQLIGDFALTAGNAIETAPSLACNTSRCFVAFLQRQGGDTQLMGRRLETDADPDPMIPIEVDLVLDNGATAESPPHVLATSSGFIVMWPDDRNAANGNDIFARTVPNLTPISPVAGTNLVAAPLGQGGVTASAIGPGTDFLAVWDDQRAGAADPDVWGSPFTTALAATGGGERLLNGMVDVQQSPVVAADAAGGLVVWQDRRGGAIGLTYATRVDASGSPLDPEGFPVIALPANVIESTVVKGPGTDYLVMGVRTQPAPSAIYYRIVRDELPAGDMDLDPSSVTTVDADGLTAATLLFTPGPTAYAPGFELADGVLYTVTVDNANVVVSPPDRDPNTAGHQVGIFDGNIGLSLTSLIPAQVSVTIESVDGTSLGTTDVTFLNVPPVASNALISPATPNSGQDLTLSYDYADINGDLESGTQITWTRNGAAVGQFQDQTTVTANGTLRNDVWQVSVRPRDGANFGQIVFSQEVTILNSPPVALDPRIVPDTDVKVNTELLARYAFDDPDNDAESNTVLRWFESGSEQTDLLDSPTVPASRVFKGQVWNFSVLPSDGTDAGPLATSPDVTIENTAPVADAGARVTVIERRPASLDATGSSDADPSDGLTYAWRQLDGQPTPLSNTSTPTPSLTAPSVTGTEILVYALIVSDGTTDSIEDTVVVEISPVRDNDSDGLDDEEEADLGTDPNRGDTDMDSLLDGAEVAAGTDPFDADSDDDGVRDGAEVDPAEDSDLDGMVNALDPDSDNDGVLDGTEAGVIEPLDDTDLSAGNFTPDADRDTTTDPTVADSDGDGLSDGEEDTNKNGRVDLGESDPNDPTSTVGCSADMTCPGNLVCTNNACRDPMPDGGMMCSPLAELDIVCCMDSCQGGTGVAPVCSTPGSRETCPTSARQCPVGSCMPPDGNTPDGDGGGCSATGTGGSKLGLLWLLGLLLVGRRRRR